MTKLKLLIPFIILTLSTLAQTQPELSPRRILDPNLFFGGNLGLSFGSVTSIDLSPIVGYRLIRQQLALGLGLTYQYYNNKTYQYTYHVYGARAFAQYSPERLSQLLLHAEYEYLHFDFPDENSPLQFDTENPLVGAGYRIKMGQRSYSTVLFLWNLNGNSTLYQNPIMRVGFTF
jgi:hypothetical protein